MQMDTGVDQAAKSGHRPGAVRLGKLKRQGRRHCKH